MTAPARKLGIERGGRVLVVGDSAEAAVLDALLPEDVQADRTPQAGVQYDVIVLFAPDYATLAARFAALIAHMTLSGGLWVAYYKKSSGVPTDLTFAVVPTDLTFAVVQQHGLDAGLVDNKVCAIDAQWTGLRFVIRRRDRR